MKSKKWLISLVLVAALVMAFVLPGASCEPELKEYWYTPEGEKISFDITTLGGTYSDVGLMLVTDLQDFGLDVGQVVLDSGTFYDYLYEPNLGGMEAFMAADDPSPDPWSDWIWIYLSDPEDWGSMWNPCWYNNERYNELWVANYLAPNLTAKKAVLHEMQEIMARDVPLHFLVRTENIAVHRTDNWDNWFNEIGGYVTWLNEWSIREVTKRGDETQLKLGDVIFNTNLNMDQETLMYTNIGCLYLMLVYENLAFYPKVDEDLGDAYDFVGKLATDYKWGHEGTNQTLTIDLREGVKWSDGENFTADDVVYTLKYVTNKWGVNKPIDWNWVYNASNPNQWDITADDVLVEKIGEYQVKFTFVEGWHQNEGFFPSVYMWDAVVPEHVFGPAGNGTQDGWMADPLEWDGNYIGTGPYMVKEWVPDSHLLLERNEDYWGPKPEAEQVLFRLYTDSGMMFTELEAGEIDCTLGDSPPPAKVGPYEDNPDLEVDPVSGLGVYYLGFNLHPEAGYLPFQDVELRKAIAYAIDKQDIVDMVMGGYGEVAYSWVYNESPNFNPDLAKYDYDTTAAENLLLAANYTKHVEE